MKKIGNLTLIHLSGSAYEQGFQHGQLMGERARKGAVSYFQRFLELTVRNSEVPWAAGPMLKLLDWRVSRRLARQLPGYMQEMVKGLADGAGIDREELLQAFTMPETFLALIAYWQKLMRASPVGPVTLASAPVCGCTSVIATRSATADGKLYHARNFDYPAVGYWDRDLVVAMTTPKDGMPYMSVVSAGIPAGGITGMNQAGISIVAHQHWISDVDLDGVPVGVASEAALRHASSIEDAIRIILEHRAVAGFTYLISDGKTKEAVALEVAPRRHGIVRLGDTGVPDALGYSNAYVSPEMQKYELGAFHAYWENCESRLEWTNRLLAERAGAHTPESLAAILGDDREPRGKARRLFGNVIPSVLTVASVVFDPEDLVMWVSEAPAPSCHGRFVPFSLNERDESRTARSFETPGFGDAARARAYQEYVSAYRAHFERGDERAALEHVRAATSGAAGAPELWQLRGLLALRAQEPVEAVDCLEKAIPLFGGENSRVAESKLALARARDLVDGGRPRARELYRELAEDARSPEHVRKAARAGLRMPFSKSRAGKLSVDFVFGTLL